jgi:hypothetical protein
MRKSNLGSLELAIMTMTRSLRTYFSRFLNYLHYPYLSSSALQICVAIMIAFVAAYMSRSSLARTPSSPPPISIVYPASRSQWTAVPNRGIDLVILAEMAGS